MFNIGLGSKPGPFKGKLNVNWTKISKEGDMNLLTIDILLKLW